MNKLISTIIVMIMIMTMSVSTTYALGGKSSSKSSFSSRPSKSSFSSRPSKSSFSSRPSKSSFSSSKPTQITRNDKLSSLSKKGATGANAGLLFKEYRAKKDPVTYKVTPSTIKKSFEPGYSKQRKRDFYSGYTPSFGSNYQRVVVDHQNSGYGIWDMMLFASILDNVGDRQMYYHHQNDPSFKAWRQDANAACANGDKVICEKLADLDKEMLDYQNKGIVRNNKYITPGIEPDIYKANNIDPTKLSKINVCTGNIGSDYLRFTSTLSNITKLSVESINTNGSVDNLTKLANGTCDIAFSQQDLVSASPELVSIATISVPQAALLVCGTDIKTIDNLTDKNIIYIGSDQTGSEYTFNQLKQYKTQLNNSKVNTSKITMQSAIDLLPTDCMFSVTSPDSSVIKKLDSGKFNLIPLELDKDNVKYKPIIVDYSHYNNLTQKEYAGIFSQRGTSTVGIPTVMVATQQWTESNKTIYNLLLLQNETIQTSLR